MSTTTRRASRGRTGKSPAVTTMSASPPKPVPSWPLSDTPLYNLRFSKLNLPFALTAGMYALIVEGNCLAPEISDGDTVIIEPATWPQPGDFVCIHFNTGAQPIVKRLVDKVYPRYFQIRPEDEVAFAFRVEMLRPQKTLWVNCFLVAAIHRVVHVLRIAKDADAERLAG